MLNYTMESEVTTPVVDHPTIISMDPKLQRMLLQKRSGRSKAATASTSKDEVAVVARVSDEKKWMVSPMVKKADLIGNANNEKDKIVTGRVPIAVLEKLRTEPFVKSLKAANRMRPNLSHTTKDIEAGKLLPPAMKTKDGEGVIVGIIDSGCDFAHQNFQTSQGASRILEIWDQASSGKSTAVKYGKLYSNADINKALAATNPYSALKYRRLAREEHGTHVMDIACGNGIGTGVPGVAPAADIIFVEVDSTDIPDFTTATVGKSFGDSVHLLEAIKYIFDKAGTTPCVVNISLGTNGGPHDGTTLVDQGIDSLLTKKPNRAVVIAASNSYEDGIHAAGTIPPGAAMDLTWLVDKTNDSENEMEIWFSGKDRLDVEVIDPSGKSLGIVNPGETGSEKDNGDIYLFVSNRLDDPNNHDNMIGIWLKEGFTGKWTVRLKNNQNNKVDFHAWIERDDDEIGIKRQSTFKKPFDNSHTVGSISCSRLSITVGSYNAHSKVKKISSFSSSGPTRDGRAKPEIAAPGDNVVAAGSLTGNQTVVMSGTSMASPAVSGCIAVLFSEAKSRKINLSIGQVRKIVMDNGRKTPPVSVPDNRYGSGRISITSMINSLIKTQKTNTKSKTKKPVKKGAVKKTIRKKTGR